MIELQAKEKDKYDRMHQIDGYSPGPGLSFVSNALRYIKQGDSIIDFGCGTGDAAQAFIDLGHDVHAVDISSKGLHHDLGKKYHQSSLHDLPKELPLADWGFCVDVMEHVPTPWVDIALWQMSRKVENCFFSISGQKDGWGAKINDVLHLTVMPGEWWLGKISEHWHDVRWVNTAGNSYEIVAKGAKRD